MWQKLRATGSGGRLIGVDTNVLVRLVVTDDRSQHDASVAFFGERTRASPAHVSVAVIIEMFWVLSRIYKLPVETVLDMIDALTGRPDLIIENEDCVTLALRAVKSLNAGFVDLLIAGINQKMGCDRTVTFDRKAARAVSEMELLS